MNPIDATNRELRSLRDQLSSVGVPDCAPTAVEPGVVIWEGSGVDLARVSAPCRPLLSFTVRIERYRRVGQALIYAHPSDGGPVICVDWSLNPRRVRVWLLGQRFGSAMTRVVIAWMEEDLEDEMLLAA